MKQRRRQRKTEAKKERRQQQREALKEEKFWASSHLRELKEQLKLRAYTNPTTSNDRDWSEDKHKVRIWKASEVSRRKRPPKKQRTKIINKANSMNYLSTQHPRLDGYKARAASKLATGNLMLDNPSYLGEKISSTATSFSKYYFGKSNHELLTTNIQQTVAE